MRRKLFDLDTERRLSDVRKRPHPEASLASLGAPRDVPPDRGTDGIPVRPLHKKQRSRELSNAVSLHVGDVASTDDAAADVSDQDGAVHEHKLPPSHVARTRIYRAAAAREDLGRLAPLDEAGALAPPSSGYARAGRARKSLVAESEATSALFAALDGIEDDRRPHWALAGTTVRIFGLRQPNMRCYNGCVGIISQLPRGYNGVNGSVPVRVIGFNKLMSLHPSNLTPILPAAAEGAMPIQSSRHAGAEDEPDDLLDAELDSPHDSDENLSESGRANAAEPSESVPSDAEPRSEPVRREPLPPRASVIAHGCNLLLDLGTAWLHSKREYDADDLQPSASGRQWPCADLAESSPTGSSASDSHSQATTTRAPSESSASGSTALGNVSDGSGDMVDA
jgi:hypothetical protein